MNSIDSLPRPGSESRIQTASLMILAAGVLTYMVYWLRPVLVPLVVAWFVVSGLKPILIVLERSLHVNRVVAAGITFLAGVGVLVLFGLALWASVVDLSQNADDYQHRVEEIVQWGERALPDSLAFLGETVPAEPAVERNSQRLGLVDALVQRGISAVSQTLLALFSSSVIVLIYVFFLLIGSPDASSNATLQEIDRHVRGYISLKTAISLVTGGIFGLVLWLFGVPMAFTFGTLAFLLNFIPNVGPILATVLPLPLVLLEPNAGIGWMFATMLIASAVQLISGNFVEPKLMGNSSDLHPVTILLALMFWGMMWGLVGMFLAVPITAGIKIVLERIEAAQPVANLMAGRVSSTPAQPA
jgi:AI-2 transport protein TqsA